jgi:hypothetical protein
MLKPDNGKINCDTLADFDFCAQAVGAFLKPIRHDDGNNYIHQSLFSITLTVSH